MSELVSINHPLNFFERLRDASTEEYFHVLFKHTHHCYPSATLQLLWIRKDTISNQQEQEFCDRTHSIPVIVSGRCVLNAVDAALTPSWNYIRCTTEGEMYLLDLRRKTTFYSRVIDLREGVNDSSLVKSVADALSYDAPIPTSYRALQSRKLSGLSYNKEEEDAILEKFQGLVPSLNNFL